MAARIVDLRKSLDDKVSDYSSPGFAQIDSRASVSEAAKAMQTIGATEAVVMEQGKPVGIVTERDILYKVVAVRKDPSTLSVSQVMSSPIETVGGDVKVVDAIAKMSKMGVRRLGVIKDGELIGLVTQKALVSGGVDRSLVLPELAHPERLACPYCGETMKDKDELSRHIDQIHVGLGLLEGNLKKW